MTRKFTEAHKIISDPMIAQENLRTLWSLPEEHVVPHSWRLPRDVRIGLGSGNREKVKTIQETVSNLGGNEIVSRSPDEDAIKQLLKLYWGNSDESDPWRVTKIAFLKSLFPFAFAEAVTHGLGIDTDVFLVGEGNNPLGIAHNDSELGTLVRNLSGKIVQIKVAGVLSEIAEMRAVAFDEITVSLKLRNFTENEYFALMGYEAIGKISGGINYADSRAIELINPNKGVIIDRVIHLSPHILSDEQNRRFVCLDPKVVYRVIPDYFSAPSQLIKWILYNGLTPEKNIPFPWGLHDLR